MEDKDMMEENEGVDLVKNVEEANYYPSIYKSSILITINRYNHIF